MDLSQPGKPEEVYQLRLVESPAWDSETGNRILGNKENTNKTKTSVNNSESVAAPCVANASY